MEEKMKSFIYSGMIVDLENPVYLVKNKLRELISLGKLDPAFDFSEKEIVLPLLESIRRITRIRGYLTLKPLLVVGKRNKKLFSHEFTQYNFVVAPDPFRDPYPNNQAADIFICKRLRAFGILQPMAKPLLLVSGDGGFSSTMRRVKENGRQVLVIAPEWGLNKSYVNELGEDCILSLTEEWLIKDLITTIIKYLPYAE
jgi:hypothetical protein